MPTDLNSTTRKIEDVGTDYVEGALVQKEAEYLLTELGMIESATKMYLQVRWVAWHFAMCMENN